MYFFYTMVDLSQGGTIDMIKRDTISDILYELRDGKCHTYAELAEAAEVSLITVRRCIESLSYHHPIVIFQGQRSDGRRGVQLEVFIDPAFKLCCI